MARGLDFYGRVYIVVRARSSRKPSRFLDARETDREREIERKLSNSKDQKMYARDGKGAIIEH